MSTTANQKDTKLFYAIKNLRSIKEMEMLELKPITILVGENSAGKSSFIRSIPLICQSIGAITNSPILWYDDNFVDFGDYKSAVRGHRTQNTISFCFEIQNVEIVSSLDLYPMGIEKNYTEKLKCDSINFNIVLGENEGQTVRKKIEMTVSSNDIEANDHKISAEFHFSENIRTGYFSHNIECVNVNGVVFKNFKRNWKFIYDSSEVFPAICFIGLDNDRFDGIRSNLIRYYGSEGIFQDLIQNLESFISEFDNSIQEKIIATEAAKILKYPKLTKNIISNLQMDAENLTIKKFYKNLLMPKYVKQFDFIASRCSLYWVIESLNVAGDIFSDFFQKISYIGPARVRSERFYRLQELEVSKISPDGKNLHMFLASLAQRNLIKNFSDWVNKLLGFQIIVSKYSDPVRIDIKKNGLKVNITDTGYGISQILPIIAQIWNVTQNERNLTNLPLSRYSKYKNTQAVILEQPELHLHPAHQKVIAEAILLAINGNQKNRPVFVVETHSEVLINRLGDLIENGELSPDKVQVVMFSINENNTTTIKTSHFNEVGELDQEWPYGFFEY